MRWITALPYPWCAPDEAIRDMPHIDSLEAVKRYLREASHYFSLRAMTHRSDLDGQQMTLNCAKKLLFGVQK
jgi:hypothetical protein